MEQFVKFIEQISILVGIWAAIYGINSWRREHRGKRQIELAEDALALFYEARDAIAGMRHPVSFSGELDAIERGEGEPENVFTARRNASLIFVRYERNSELFNKIHAMRYRFMALIGKEQAKPFEDLRNIENDLFQAARMLARLWPRDHFRTKADRDKHFNQIVEFEEIFWGVGGEEDPIEPRIQSVIDEIEAVCSKVIVGKKSWSGRLRFSSADKG
ncbi:hypothetical protein [Cyanobium sp. Copco_Reservoir_LC18]|uniref:hypothetical protein n=1 Tax=Cyanobium sp. Copco_Reservoir_LC18 TaxID=1328305 RepID=UPI00135749FF|nr:hypothetical protein [Cyanobium sp. Copco_Reservoir_LC18]